MKDVIILCKKEVVNANGAKFDAYYAYRQVAIPGTNPQEYEDRKTEIIIDGKVSLISRPINVKIAESFKKELEDAEKEGLRFPLLMFLDSDNKVVGKDGKKVDSYYVTEDKDKDKKVRLDKNGRRHLILVVRHGTYCEAPRKSYSLDDLDTYEG